MKLEGTAWHRAWDNDVLPVQMARGAHDLCFVNAEVAKRLHCHAAFQVSSFGRKLMAFSIIAHR